MAKLLARVAPWLPSARAQADPEGPWSFRVLGEEDTRDLWAIVNDDPVANVFVASHLESMGSAAPSFSGGEIIGMFRHHELRAACWAGVNLVPVGVTDETGAIFGDHLGRSGRSFSSIFGLSEGVMDLWSTFEDYSAEPFDVRPTQPLMSIDTDPLIPPATDLRFTRPEELDRLLPACAAMFEEEVGYSPFIGGSEHYRRRVASLISRKHSLAAFDDSGQVVFKAELGTVSSQAVQVQGVWMNPDHRGRGLSAAYMAGVVVAARALAPTVSLYVNSYNARAIAAYKRVGFDQVDTFATILF
ncbi:GNAT family N-acetyltransferase [Arthrobacter agilis]|jgi:predicted GNAT family acetyltransferase|uniref:GNAT family N-acetyltransferase n=1 Tax=Arthrobacter agilis TaxID=37921 RepID=UPI0027818E4B|nr:GNAT family N-acetyltransferase [Arthrobacter agilis]MDQ0734211.1 putative GNAT family acetyltransferase [Arthrobacter agilis]